MCKQCKILTQQLAREQACSQIGYQQRDRTITVLLDVAVVFVKFYDGDTTVDDEYIQQVANYVTRIVNE